MPTPQEVTLLESRNNVYKSNLMLLTSNLVEKATFLFCKIHKQQEDPTTVLTSNEKQIIEIANSMKAASEQSH